jgi:hypothetical protein
LDWTGPDLTILIWVGPRSAQIIVRSSPLFTCNVNSEGRPEKKKKKEEGENREAGLAMVLAM